MENASPTTDEQALEMLAAVAPGHDLGLDENYRHYREIMSVADAYLTTLTTLLAALSAHRPDIVQRHIDALFPPTV